MLRINKMIKQVLLYFFTTILPVFSSSWAWLGVCCIAVVYKTPVPRWLFILTWCNCFYSLINNCELFRGFGLESEYVTKYIYNPHNPINPILRRQTTYKVLKKTAEMLGYPNCLIKFESEKKDGDCVLTTWRIPNKNVYNALEKFFGEATKLYDEK